MANTLHWATNASGAGITGPLNAGTSWQEGLAPQGGDQGIMASTGTASVNGDSGTVFPNNFTFIFGLSQADTSATTTSNLSLTDASVPSGAVVNVTLPGGSYTGGATGPVIQGGLGVHGSVSFAGTINVGAGDSLKMGIDASPTGVPGVFNNTGTINLAGQSGNQAFMTVGQGSQLGTSTAGAYANYGTINISQGIFVARATDLPPSGVPTGTSTFNLANNGYLRFENDTHANTTVNFQDGNNNRLILAPDANNQIVFGGAVNGFRVGDRIGVVNAQVNSLNYDQNTGILHVNGPNGIVTNIKFNGSYTQGDFSFVQNPTPTGGYSTEFDIRTTVTNPVCFASGTRIRTMRGEVAVEDLQRGDMAVTATGALRTVVWTGHRVFEGGGRPLPHDIQPVWIRAGAFGAGLPARNLLLSPGHPILVGAGADEVLVPIMCLINGTSIARMPIETVTYWHVELDKHDILLAEGLPAESFLDWGNRSWFENGADHALANPDFILPGLNGRCRPVEINGSRVEAERRRLDGVFHASLIAHCAWPTDERWLAA